jgi:hypothetical protein
MPTDFVDPSGLDIPDIGGFDGGTVYGDRDPIWGILRGMMGSDSIPMTAIITPPGMDLPGDGGGGGVLCPTGIPTILGQIRSPFRFSFGTGRGSWRRSLGTSPSTGRFGQTNQQWYGQHLNSSWGRQERLDAMVFAGGNPLRFKQLAGRRSGYDWHHVVEQNQTQFGSLRLNSIGNMIQIPTSLHNKISGYYNSTRFDFTNGQSVRNWLRNQSFEQQHAFGIRVLQQFGAIPCGL